MVNILLIRVFVNIMGVFCEKWDQGIGLLVVGCRLLNTRDQGQGDDYQHRKMP